MIGSGQASSWQTEQQGHAWRSSGQLLSNAKVLLERSRYLIIPQLLFLNLITLKGLEQISSQGDVALCCLQCNDALLHEGRLGVRGTIVVSHHEVLRQSLDLCKEVVILPLPARPLALQQTAFWCSAGRWVPFSPHSTHPHSFTLLAARLMLARMDMPASA